MALSIDNLTERDIAKTIDHLWDTVPRIDILYICSNGSIARQNLAILS